MQRPGSRVGMRDTLSFIVPAPIPPEPKYPFPFLKLPIELQIKTLSYLLPGKKVLEVPENTHNSNGATGWNNEKYGTWVDYWNPGDTCQPSILQASKHLYNIGKDALYGRTLRFHVWENGIDFLDEQLQVDRLPCWFRYDYFRKLSIQVHPTDFTYYDKELRQNFLGVCGFLANNVEVIEDLEIEFMGETWDPENHFRWNIDTGFKVDRVSVGIERRREEVDYRYSEAEIVAWMLGPIAQIQNVNRISIRLPESVATDTSLLETAERYRKVALGIERFQYDKQMLFDDFATYKDLYEWHDGNTCFCWEPTPAPKLPKEIVAFGVELENDMDVKGCISEVSWVNSGN